MILNMRSIAEFEILIYNTFKKVSEISKYFFLNLLIYGITLCVFLHEGFLKLLIVFLLRRTDCLAEQFFSEVFESKCSR